MFPYWRGSWGRGWKVGEKMTVPPDDLNICHDICCWMIVSFKTTNGHSSLFWFGLVIYKYFTSEYTTSDLPVWYNGFPGLLKMLSLYLEELPICWDGNCFNFDVLHSAHLFQLFYQTHSQIYHLCMCSYDRTASVAEYNVNSTDILSLLSRKVTGFVARISYDSVSRHAIKVIWENILGFIHKGQYILPGQFTVT